MKEEIYGEELSAVQDQYKIVELLLENGAVTSTTDSDGRTALDYVTKYDDVVARWKGLIRPEHWNQP